MIFYWILFVTSSFMELSGADNCYRELQPEPYLPMYFILFGFGLHFLMLARRGAYVASRLNNRQGWSIITNLEFIVEAGFIGSAFHLKFDEV